MNSTPTFEKISKFLIILFIIGILGNYLFSNTLSSFLSLEDIGQYKSHLHILSIAQAVLLLLINIVIGIWVYKKASSNKWGWMLLAFVFGINAIILFYLNQVLNELQNKSSKL
jgi:hypothetical protein